MMNDAIHKPKKNCLWSLIKLRAHFIRHVPASYSRRDVWPLRTQFYEDHKNHHLWSEARLDAWWWMTRGMNHKLHYCDAIMDTVASQITSLTIVYTTVYSDADQSKHQSSASLAFVWGIHWGPVNSPHKWPVTRKMFPFDGVIMHAPAPEYAVTKDRHYINHVLSYFWLVAIFAWWEMM